MIRMEYAGEVALIRANGIIRYESNQPWGWGENRFPLPALVKWAEAVRELAYPLAPGSGIIPALVPEWTTEDILRQEG